MIDRRVPFETIYPKAYGWTIDEEGYLAGLVSGDMGYESTDRKLEDLWIDAQVKENVDNRTGKRIWPVHNAMMMLVRSFVKTLYPAIQTDEFYEGAMVTKKPDTSGPHIMGKILFTHRKDSGLLQLVIQSAAHDKLQVVWASDFELFVPE